MCVFVFINIIYYIQNTYNSIVNFALFSFLSWFILLNEWKFIKWKWKEWREMKWNESNWFSNLFSYFLLLLLHWIFLFKYISPNLQPKFLYFTRIHPTFHSLINILSYLKTFRTLPQSNVLCCRSHLFLTFNIRIDEYHWLLFYLFIHTYIYIFI